MKFEVTLLIKALIALISVAIKNFLIPYLKSKTKKENQDKNNK